MPAADLVQALGGGHQVVVERFRHSARQSEADEQCSHLSHTWSNGLLSGCILCRCWHIHRSVSGSWSPSDIDNDQGGLMRDR
jgi:hypothetical protein